MQMHLPEKYYHMKKQKIIKYSLEIDYNYWRNALRSAAFMLL